MPEEHNNELPSIEDIVGQQEILPSVEEFIVEEKNEDIQTIEDAEGNTFIEVQDLVKPEPWVELVRMINDVRESIPEIPEIKNYDKEIKTLNELKLKISDHEKTELSFDDNNEITVLNPKYKNVLLPPEIPENYINSYVNLVTETKFLDNENVIQISEKSFKPFFYYQFPMILATHHHIKAMKEKYDFDFFDDVIDHSYDNEPDQKKRFNLFVNEVKRLHDNKENLIEFYRNNQLRFEINKNKVISIMNNDSDYIFFRSLIN